MKDECTDRGRSTETDSKRDREDGFLCRLYDTKISVCNE